MWTDCGFAFKPRVSCCDQFACKWNVKNWSIHSTEPVEQNWWTIRRFPEFPTTNDACATQFFWAWGKKRDLRTGHHMHRYIVQLLFPWHDFDAHSLSVRGKFPEIRNDLVEEKRFMGSHTVSTPAVWRLLIIAVTFCKKKNHLHLRRTAYTHSSYPNMLYLLFLYKDEFFEVFDLEGINWFWEKFAWKLAQIV